MKSDSKQVSAWAAQGVAGIIAGPGTLVEVLDVLEVASDADVAAICGVFEARNIHHLYPSPSACRPCYADCDQSTGIGVLDAFDFVCFQSAFVAGCP